MIQLTHEERRTIAQRVAYMLSRCEEHGSWEKVLQEAYCEFMPDKTEAQGELAARHILDTMGEFETMYDVARTDSRVFAEYYLNALTEGKSLEQQCRSLYSLIKGIETFDDAFARERMREKDGALVWVEAVQDSIRYERYGGPITEKARDELMAQARKKILEARMTNFAMENLVNLMDEYPDQAHNVFGYACGDHVFRSLSAMVIYTMAKKGELRFVPRQITAREVTYTVCAEDAMRQLVSNAEKGYIDTVQYRAHKKALWQALQIGIVAGLVLLGGSAVAAAIAEEQIVGAVLAGFAAIYGIAICLGPMDDTVQRLIEHEVVPIQEDIPVYNRAEEILDQFEDSFEAGYQEDQPSRNYIFETQQQENLDFC